jgi:UDP-2,3-diacylglucosamine pyrophosphatase LpxH
MERKMDYSKRVSDVYRSSRTIDFDDSSRFIIMSDCHRGDGGWADSFSKNQNVYFHALNHYYNRRFTYIELGDGDELWEYKKMQDIVQEHSDVFWMLRKFYKKNRLWMIYGNHDIVKRNPSFVKNNLSSYISVRENGYVPLFENLEMYEGLVLKHKETNEEIFLIHGHQVDFLNSSIWMIARFLVRYFWRPLESFGVNDVTRTAKNYSKKNAVAKKLSEWAEKENKAIIAGHNHKPSFPDNVDAPYFNDGSCVHPRCITGIEICDGEIILVKWSVKSGINGQLEIGRDILADPRKINEILKKEKSFL